jgi:hypothetical protein
MDQDGQQIELCKARLATANLDKEAAPGLANCHHPTVSTLAGRLRGEYMIEFKRIPAAEEATEEDDPQLDLDAGEVQAANEEVLKVRSLHDNFIRNRFGPFPFIMLYFVYFPGRW